MVYLRNFEREARTGAPISGATVRIYDAVLGGAHGAALTFTDHNDVSGTSTTTNPDGMWEAKDLPDGAYYDVQIEYNAQFKWYFGRTMHQVERLSDDQTPAENHNLILNGNHDSWARWIRNGSVNIAGIIDTAVEISDFWYATITGGDSLSGTRSSPTGIAALMASALTWTRVGGVFTYQYFEPDTRKARALRGQTVTAALLVHQSANARLKPFIYDGIGTTYGSVYTTIGSWSILTVTRAIDTGATAFQVGVQSDTPSAGSYTIQITNCMVGYGAVTPTYSHIPNDAGMPEHMLDRFLGTHTLNDAVTAPSQDLGYQSEINDWFARQIRLITGGADWYTAPTSTLAALLASVNAKLPLAGGTMTGQLILAHGFSNGISLLNNAAVARPLAATNGNDLFAFGTAYTGIYLLSPSGTIYAHDGTNVYKLWHEGNDGPGSGLNADTVDGIQAAAFALLSGATFTGAISVLRPLTIRGGGGVLHGQLDINNAGNTLAMSLQYDGTNLYFISPGPNVRLQIPNVGSGSVTIDGATVVTLGNDGAGSSVDADLLDGSHGSAYLARANHTGTQLAATISDLAATVATLTANHATTAGIATTVAANGVDTAAKIADGIITDAEINSSNKDGAAGTASMRTIGTGAQQAAAGNHTHSNPTSMAKVAVGTYNGTDAASRSITGLGFQPKEFRIQKTTSSNAIAMSVGHDLLIMQHSVATLFASGVSLDADGFTFPNSGVMNVLGQSYRWIAIG